MQKQNYNTKAKRFILDCLENNSHTTVAASDILEYLNKNGIFVNLTTVYRCLEKLTNECKVIKLKNSDGRGAVYQLSAAQKTCDEHIHIQCVNCGKLSHLDCGFMDELKKHIKSDHGFEIKCSGSVLYGVCKECKK